MVGVRTAKRCKQLFIRLWVRSWANRRWGDFRRFRVRLERYGSYLQRDEEDRRLIHRRFPFLYLEDLFGWKGQDKRQVCFCCRYGGCPQRRRFIQGHRHPPLHGWPRYQQESRSRESYYLKTTLSATSGRQNVQTKETSHRSLFFLCFLAQKHSPNITKTAKNAKISKIFAFFLAYMRIIVYLCAIFGSQACESRKNTNDKSKINNYKQF